ncbi:hypothetical protein GBAR_LOCUS1077 [Geodia barretti]|uniref:Uncharacterized protein n=1 Tax=Geodia barretti TaxID=519541 RepID=A0AA35W228_GEOBA|nr:hypothetical protein GBAR_LOCUS1077 [Geodia barretti]
MPVVYSHCWSRTVMESLTERGLKPPDHVVLDDHRNKGLCPLSFSLLSSTLTVLVSYCCRNILLYANGKQHSYTQVNSMKKELPWV